MEFTLNYLKYFLTPGSKRVIKTHINTDEDISKNPLSNIGYGLESNIPCDKTTMNPKKPNKERIGVPITQIHHAHFLP